MASLGSFLGFFLDDFSDGCFDGFLEIAGTLLGRGLYCRGQIVAWQCAQVPVISTTASFGAKPVARAAAARSCATGAAGISPTEPQWSQIRKATNAALSWSCAQARKELRLSMRWTSPFSIRKSSAR